MKFTESGAMVLDKSKNVLPEKDKRERMRYTSFMINYWAESYKMNKPKAYLYLEKYGGLDYIRENWWALHTDNNRHVVREIFDYCQKKGGYLK
jgi:hypothetical protein